MFRWLRHLLESEAKKHVEAPECATCGSTAITTEYVQIVDAWRSRCERGHKW